MKIVQIKDLLRQKIIQIPALDDVEFKSQEKILLEQDNDLIVAKVISGDRNLPGAKTDDTYTFKKKLTPEEFSAYHALDAESFERVKKARDLVLNLSLEMHIFASRSNYDDKILSFFFTARDNIDFRQLVKDLAKVFKRRIHIQRVTEQERSTIIGGVGVCGREECCSYFKVTPERATMDAVRDQGIMIKHNDRIYGVNGKLKDCLLYERDFYRKQRRYFPHIKQKVEINGRSARVKNVDILSEKIKVIFDEGLIDTFDIREIRYDNQIPIPPREDKAIEMPVVDFEGTVV